MSGHTPEKWIRDGLSIYAFMHAGWRHGEEELKNRFYLRIYGDRECPEEEIEANARLIAAAPMLLEACELFAAYDSGDPDDFEQLVHGYAVAIEATRAAIAAATGETK